MDNEGEPGMDAVNGSWVVVEENPGKQETSDAEQGFGLTSRGAGWANPTHCRANSTNCAEVCVREGGAGEVHPHVTCGAQEGVPAQVKVADGAGILGLGGCANRAWVRVDITTD